MTVVRRILLLLVLLATPARAEQARVHFFDVGQGDAVLIQSPSGHNVIYDGGPTAEGLLAHLQALGVSSIDLVIASHNHADHIAGLPAVIQHYRPRFFLDNGLPATTLAYQRLLAAVGNAGSQLLEPSARRITLGDVVLSILPPSGMTEWDQNDNSVGVLMEYGAFRLSLAGDAEQRQWKWWIQRHADLLGAVDVHKASHHGSRTGDTRQGITKLAPAVVIISAGEGNQFGHPHQELLQLYRNAKIYRTDLQGTILVEGEQSGHYTVYAGRLEAARAPPAQPTLEPECIDLNNASLTELQQIIHIGEARAREIIDIRLNRPFRSVQEISRVRGIGEARMRDIINEGKACVR